MMRKICLLVVAVFFSSRAFAQTALPPGASLVGIDPLPAFQLQTQLGHDNDAHFELTASGGPGFSRAFRVDTLREAENPMAIAVNAANVRPVKQGDVALVRFFARTLSSADETGSGRLQVVVRRNGPEPTSSLNVSVNVGREWQEFLFPFAFAHDYAPGEAVISFRFGFKKQSVEVGGIDLVTYGNTKTVAELPRTHFTYKGEEANAAWRKAALERIERIRKGDLTLRVLDASNRPVPGATVEIVERRSAFQWGSALQFGRLVHDSPDNLVYRQKVLELFNEASPENDLKWGAWLGEFPGNYSHDDAIAALRWLQQHDFYTRGHVLVWPGWHNLPKGIQALRDTPKQKDIPGLVTQHIREMADATRGLLREWDVLNEPYTNHDLMDIFGPEIMVDWFNAARAELGPDVKLFLNDFSNHDQVNDAEHVAHFEKTVAFLQAHHAPLDGLGIQAHIGGQPNDPETILATFDRYQKFGLPLRITEFDVMTDDEQLQANFTRDFLILAFSHPSVEGVQLWGFWENAHWRPNAAMYRADWSEKPNGAIYRSLVLEQWRTHLTTQTDASARVAVRAFFGDYDAIVRLGERSVTRAFSLTVDDPSLNLEIRLP